MNRANHIVARANLTDLVYRSRLRASLNNYEGYKAEPELPTHVYRFDPGPAA